MRMTSIINSRVLLNKICQHKSRWLHNLNLHHLVSSKSCLPLFSSITTWRIDYSNKPLWPPNRWNSMTWATAHCFHCVATQRKTQTKTPKSQSDLHIITSTAWTFRRRCTWQRVYWIICSHVKMLVQEPSQQCCILLYYFALQWHSIITYNNANMLI